MRKDRRLGVAPPRSVYNKFRTAFRQTKHLVVHEFFSDMVRLAALHEQVDVKIEVSAEGYEISFREIPKVKQPSYDELLAFYQEHKNAEEQK